jgi:hypothetical protein
MTSIRALAYKLINELTHCEPYCTDCIESALLEVRNEALNQAIEVLNHEAEMGRLGDCDAEYYQQKLEALKQTTGESHE